MCLRQAANKEPTNSLGLIQDPSLKCIYCVESTEMAKIWNPQIFLRKVYRLWENKLLHHCSLMFLAKMDCVVGFTSLTEG